MQKISKEPKLLKTKKQNKSEKSDSLQSLSDSVKRSVSTERKHRFDEQSLEKNLPKAVMQKLNSFKGLSELPEELTVSTITVTCGFDTIFNTENIGKYVDLSPKGIVSVKYGNREEFIRSLIPPKRKNNKNKKARKTFYNQTTVIIKTDKYTNVKIFKNGSIQMTGCKNIENFAEVLEILCKELMKVKAVLNPDLNKIEVKPFLTNPGNLGLSKITNFNIRMINSNFNVGFKIDRERLYLLLLKQNVECRYEPCVHACVNMKYNYSDTEKISIFIFESGSIIITGAKNKDHIMEAYMFITTVLYENYNKLVLSSLEVLLARKDVQEILYKAGMGKKNKTIDDFYGCTDNLSDNLSDNFDEYYSLRVFDNYDKKVDKCDVVVEI